MSRTIRNDKAFGRDSWSRRPAAEVNPKRLRRAERDHVRRQIDEMEVRNAKPD